MKTILVPVERHDLVESVLKAATLLGEMFGSYIEGFPLSPAISPFMAADVIGGTIVYDADLDGDHEGVQESRRVFEGFMRANGVSSGAAGGDRPSFSWVEGVPVGDGFLGSYGRVFDITVIGRPTTKATS